MRVGIEIRDPPIFNPIFDKLVVKNKNLAEVVSGGK